MRIVVFEDNLAVAKGIAYWLQDEGHAVDLLQDGAEAEAFLRNDGADLVVLDIKLPGMLGLDVLKAMRARGDGRPVLILTAQSELHERITGLDAGADDYLTKPFEMDELSARIRALSRRRGSIAPTLLRIGPLVFDANARVISGPEGDLSVPRREVALFETLLGASGRFVSKQDLLDDLYGTGTDVDESVVEVYASRLRKRLRPFGVNITTRRGIRLRDVRGPRVNVSLSLRLRLTLIIIVPLLVIAAAVALWAAADAQARAADRFDRSLLVTALGISRDTAISGGDALSRETRDLLRNTSGGPVYYHVYAPDGVFVTGYATPPVPPQPDDQSATTYYDAAHLGRQVRAVRFTDSMVIDGLSGDFTFTVWQDLSLRDGFVQSLSRRTYVVMATLVVAVALIVWFGVRTGLRPLLDLEQAIARRSSADLTSISRPIPKEVRGIVGRLNSLFSEMSSTMAAKDRFISDAAHQLRNPIAGVVALSEAVAASRTENDFRARSADLTEAASNAARLTEDLLAFERARSAPPWDTLPVENIGQVASELVGRMQMDAARRQVRLSLSQPKNSVLAHVDRVLLGQAIENLVRNAFMHAGPSLTDVRVTLVCDRSKLTLSVSDNGQGLAPENYTTALSRFG